jgi:hypothetical protein
MKAPNGMGTSSGYNFATDPRLIARYRANDGLADLTANPAGFGALVQTAGAVATAVGVNGRTCWQLRSASGGYLLSGLATRYETPVHIFVVAQAAAGSLPTQFWVSAQAGAGLVTVMSYSSVAAMRYDGTGNTTIACTPANLTFYNYYAHGSVSRSSVNGAAYTSIAAVGAGFGIVSGLCFGALTTGGNRGNLDLYEVFVYQGQAPAQFMSQLTAYVRATYPAIGVAANPPAVFSVNQTSLGGLFAAPFDFMLIGGQSNNANYATTATTIAGANTFQLGNDNTIAALAQLYDDPTGQIDTVSVDAVAGKAGGNFTAFANAYVAASGRPLVGVPCALGGSSMSLVSPPLSPTSWNKRAVRGFRLRDSLYGSMLARGQNMLALGGTFRALWWYQGENEAIAGGQALTDFSALTLDFFASFFADFGQPQRVLVQTIANTVAGASAPNLAAVQAAQAAFAQPGVRIVLPPSSGPYEADNIHLAASACNAVGSAAAAAAIAAGAPWI